MHTTKLRRGRVCLIQWVVGLMLGWGLPAAMLAQTSACTQVLSGTGSGAFTAYNNSTNNPQCNAWVLSWYTTGFTGISIQLEGSDDGATFTVYTGTGVVTSGVNPSTALSGATKVQVVAKIAFVRVNVTSVTGAGTVNFQLRGSSGIVSQAQPAGGGGGITGTGVANQVTYWTAPTVVAGNTNFQFNPATGSVSIGTGATPAFALDVAAQTGFVAARFKSSFAATAYIGTDSVDAWFGPGDGANGLTNAFLVNGSSGVLAFRTSNTIQAIIDAGGQLGVANPSPAYTVDIGNSLGSGTFRAFNQTAVTGVTIAAIQDGAGQAATASFQVQNNAGVTKWQASGSGPWSDTPVATASLPTWSVASPIWRGSVTDATAPAIGVALTGGGAVFATVHCSKTTGTYFVDGL